MGKRGLGRIGSKRDELRRVGFERKQLYSWEGLGWKEMS